MKLIIASKNYSSWSFRPWILLKEKNIKFEEVLIPLEPAKEFALTISPYSNSGKAPVLIDGELKIWDSLAIIEYLHEKFPEKNIYPEDAKHRAYSRAICAEMHSGFMNLRSGLPMNMRANFKNPLVNKATITDIQRVLAIWEKCLDKHGGKFLFGEFSASDAFYAPVVSRFITYNIPTSKKIQQYIKKISELKAYTQWAKDAQKSEVVEDDELYAVQQI